MLKDQDRIFTNLYGMHDRSLAGARKRGNQGRTPGTCRVGQAIFGDQVDEGLAAADDHKSPQFLTMNRGPGCGTY